MVIEENNNKSIKNVLSEISLNQIKQQVKIFFLFYSLNQWI